MPNSSGLWVNLPEAYKLSLSDIAILKEAELIVFQQHFEEYLQSLDDVPNATRFTHPGLWYKTHYPVKFAVLVARRKMGVK